MPTRRFFLRNSALAMAGVGASPLWLERALCASDGAGARKKVLVAIFQRGAADGLNVVVPHGEKAYYDLRPTIAIPRPTGDGRKKDDAAIDLDGFFGLHPALGPLKPLYDQRHLAIDVAERPAGHERSEDGGGIGLELGPRWPSPREDLCRPVTAR